MTNDTAVIIIFFLCLLGGLLYIFEVIIKTIFGIWGLFHKKTIKLTEKEHATLMKEMSQIKDRALANKIIYKHTGKINWKHFDVDMDSGEFTVKF